jgi:hypothetical protein
VAAGELGALRYFDAVRIALGRFQPLLADGESGLRVVRLLAAASLAAAAAPIDLAAPNHKGRSTPTVSGRRR